MRAVQRERGTERPSLLAQMLYDTAARHGGRPAIVFGNDTLTYAELAEATERLARGLASRGVGPGDRVALVHANAPEFVIAFFAVTALGAIVVPLNPLFAKSELGFYFDHCDVRAAITDAQRAATCATIV